MQSKIILLLACIVLFSHKSLAQVPELDWPIEIVSEGHGFTEGPVLAPDGKIFFTDMDNDLILTFDPTSGTTKVWQEKSRKANGLFIYDEFLYSCEATGRSVVRYNLSKGSDSREVLVNTFMGDSLGSPNDLTIIGDKLYFSEFWLGMYLDETSKKREIFINRVYSTSLNDNSLDTIPFDFELPNGVASSPDGKQLFIADYLPNKLYKAELINGEVGPMQLFTDLTSYGLSRPDGLTVSQDGRIFLALYGESEKVVVLASDGSVIGYLATGNLTSNCTFAGDGKTLYITADNKLKRVKIPAH